MAAVNSFRVPQAQLAPEEEPGYDLGLLVPTLFLVGLGVAMVFSASIPLSAAKEQGNVYYHLVRQLGFALIGLFFMFLISHMPMRKFQRQSNRIFGVALFLLVIVLIIGTEVRGARSWFSLPLGLRFQPSEFAKFALILAAARYFAPFPTGITTWERAWKPLAMLAATLGLVAIEPDMGTAAVIFGAMFVYFNIAGLPIRHLSALLGLGVVGVIGMIATHPYQLERITGFFGRSQAESDSGYQVTQCLIALGSGGLTGRGYCGSVWKYYYLPEAVTDSILAVIGEELGLIFTLAVLTAFALIVWRGLKVAAQAPDRFSGLVAAGVTCLIGVQALLNIGVTTHMLPATGVTLPFVSYGGSSLVFTLAGMGLLLNVSRQRLPEKGAAVIT